MCCMSQRMISSTEERTTPGNVIPTVVRLLCYFKRFLFRHICQNLVNMMRPVASFGGVYRELKSNVCMRV